MVSNQFRIGRPKKTFAYVIGACVLALSSAFGAIAESRTSTPEPALLIGAYDPYGTFSNDPTIVIEHVYIAWEDADFSSIQVANKYAMDRSRRFLLTIEPWSWSPAKAPLEPATLYQSIISGEHDTRIGALCTALNDLDREATVRFAHEMDIGNKRYPWSRWAPAEYIEAYQHFVNVCRPIAPQVRYMWSPRGEQNLQAYYPGDSYVDVIGLTVLAYQKYEVGEFGKPLSFAERLGPSYRLVAGYGKDIYIAEFGCHGDVTYVRRCRKEARNAKADFPKIAGLIYFNDVDTWPWPKAYGYPDWRIFSKMVAIVR